MSAPLTAVAAARAALKNAESARDAANVAADAQRERAADLRTQVDDLRKTSSEERVARERGEARSQTVTIGMIQETEMDAEAAKQVAGELEQKIGLAQSTVDAAQGRLNTTIGEWAVAIEEAELSEIDGLLTQLAGACARAVAAASIARDYDKRRRVSSMNMDDWFGPAGKFIGALGGLNWLELPISNKIFRRERLGTGPMVFPGVEEAVEALNVDLEGASA